MTLSRAGIHKLIKESPETVVDLILSFAEQAKAMEKQAQQIEQLQKQVAELKQQIGKNSQNSHKPPSTDGLQRPAPKSQRRGGGKRGRQPGHRGETRRQVETPDEVVEHRPVFCSHCEHELEDVEGIRIEKRQVFDVVIERKVVEHRCVSGKCPICGGAVRGSFPEGVQGPVQYGNGIQALVVYLSVYQHIPAERMAELLGTLLGGQNPSTGTIMNMLSRAGDKVAPHVDHIREALLNEEVLHCDETGIRAVKKKWLHVVSSRRYTYYQAHEKRGYAAIADMGILPRFSGVMVHDFWKTYFNGNLPGHHAMCNDHLLRELQGIIDTRPDQTWAHRMQTYLRESWKEVKIARQSATGQLPDARSRELTITYGHILKEAEEELKALTPRRVKRRKNAALSDAESLWRRFVEYGEAILRFIHDPRVPFGNSQAERDIRMMKVKLKVSGTFRTDRGADLFADLRSFVSSARKQGWDAFSALRLMLADSFSFSGLAT